MLAKLLHLSRPAWLRRAAPSLVVVAVAAILVVGGLGRALDEFAFLRPITRLRLAVGLGAPLDPRLSVVLVDDRSLQKLGRALRFADWQRIASRYFDLGASAALLVGCPNLPEQLGPLEPKDTRGKLYAGAGFVADARNPLAVEASTIPPALLEALSPEMARLAEDWPKADRIVTVASELWPLVDGLGDLTVADDNSIALGTRVGRDSFVPSLPLLASSVRALGEGLPWSVDGRLHADLVAFEDVMKASMPAFAFFDLGKGVVGALDSRVRDRLRSPGVVVLVPSAGSGQRLADTAIGKVPSYLVAVAAINGALTGRLLHRVVSDGRLVAVALLLALALPLVGGFRRQTVAVGLAMLTLAAAGTALLQVSAIIVPVASIATPILVAWAVEAWRAFLCARDDRARLRAELHLGRQVQGWTLPAQRSGDLGLWRYRIVFRPYGDLSGDWFQAYTDGPTVLAASRRTVIAIGDVVGKGVSAALATAVVSSVWKSFALMWEGGAAVDLEELTRALDRAIAQTFSGGQNSTMQIVSLTGGAATIARFAAGQWLVAGEGGIRKLRTTPTNPLGLGRALKFLKTDVEITPGEVLIACTDGVLDGSESYARFADAIQASLGAAEAAREVFERIERCAVAAGATFTLPDDFTLLMVERLLESRSGENAA